MKRLMYLTAMLFVLGTAAPLAQADEDVPFTQLPPQVQQTVQQQVRDGRITDVEVEQDGDDIVYEVEFERGGEDYEMEIAADGTLLELED